MIFKVYSTLKLGSVSLEEQESLKNFCTSQQRFYFVIQQQPKFWPSWKVPAAHRKRHSKVSSLAAAWEGRAKGMSMHQVGKPPQPISLPFTSTRNTLQDAKIYSFWKGLIPMKTQSQVIPPLCPPCFFTSISPPVKAHCWELFSPQRTQLPMVGRDPHTLPTFCSLTSETPLLHHD